MSAVAGWYPDPEQPDLLRLWDGSAWTAHTTERPVATESPNRFPGAQTALLQRTTPSVSSRRRPARPGRPGRLVTVIAAGAVAVVAGVAGLLLSGGSADSGHSVIPEPAPALSAVGNECQNVVPAGASPAAAAYIHALNAAAPSWAAVSAKLAAEKQYANQSDMAPQAAADLIFLTYLRRIQFPVADAATADELIRAVSAYRGLLLDAEKNWSLFDRQAAQRDEATEIRAVASAQLRTALHLPASSCGYWRP